MVKKIQRKTTKADSTEMPSSIKDSAQQIWQAGLAAFSRAQAEGSKALDSLVKEGVGIQRKTANAAEEKLAEASQKISTMATDISSKATGQWDKLETIFEERVAKALRKLGVPSAKDVDALMARIDALNLAVQQLSASTSTPKSAPKVPAKPSAKPAAKSTAKSAVKTAAKPAPKAAAKTAIKAPAKSTAKTT